MELQGTIQDGQLILSDTQKELEQQYLASLKNGTVVKKMLSKITLHKTWAQVKTNFGLAISFILMKFEEYGWDSSILLNIPKPTGIPVNKDLLEIYFNAIFPVLDDEGKRITLRKMNIEQASERFKNIRNYSASQWNITIPDPNPNWKQEKNNDKN